MFDALERAHANDATSSPTKIDARSQWLYEASALFGFNYPIITQSFLPRRAAITNKQPTQQHDRTKYSEGYNKTPRCYSWLIESRVSRGYVTRERERRKFVPGSQLTCLWKCRLLTFNYRITRNFG